MHFFPLISSYKTEVDYIILSEAINQNLVDVTEVDEQGSVSEIRVENRHSTMVFIIDGEELVGAKQNRVINTSILISTKTESLIPVSCVERGRWDYEGRSFKTDKRILSYWLRSEKEVR